MLCLHTGSIYEPFHSTEGFLEIVVDTKALKEKLLQCLNQLLHNVSFRRRKSFSAKAGASEGENEDEILDAI